MPFHLCSPRRPGTSPSAPPRSKELPVSGTPRRSTTLGARVGATPARGPWCRNPPSSFRARCREVEAWRLLLLWLPRGSEVSPRTSISTSHLLAMVVAVLEVQPTKARRTSTSSTTPSHLNYIMALLLPLLLLSRGARGPFLKPKEGPRHQGGEHHSTKTTFYVAWQWQGARWLSLNPRRTERERERESEGRRRRGGGLARWLPIIIM
mmetsp:Transcript_23727/g.69466  ORF Transcript_23727/g.69466 Transcript_23727/m.69466 type:complete len:208 (+) Transcript_23727:904-1527(+)